MSVSRLLLLSALLALAGCSAARARWALTEYEGISFSNLQEVVFNVLDSEGFPVKMRDPTDGVIESDWRYGMATGGVRAPSRRMAVVEIQPVDEKYMVLRLRVKQEVIFAGGLMATHLRDSDDWEPHDDDFEAAEYLVAKLNALLMDYDVQFEPTGPGVDDLTFDPAGA